MKKNYFKMVLLLVSLIPSVWANSFLVTPVNYSSDLEQHGAFVTEDLIHSPLLRSMFNLSINSLNNGLVKVCINDSNQCRILKHDSRIYLVTLNGKAKFDDSIN